MIKRPTSTKRGESPQLFLTKLNQNLFLSSLMASFCPVLIHYLICSAVILAAGKSVFLEASALDVVVICGAFGSMVTCGECAVMVISEGIDCGGHLRGIECDGHRGGRSCFSRMGAPGWNSFGEKKNRIMKIKKINKENLFITYRHERRMRQPFSVKYTSS